VPDGVWVSAADTVLDGEPPAEPLGETAVDGGPPDEGPPEGGVTVGGGVTPPGVGVGEVEVEALTQPV
jgi:hypothetical protein